MPQSRLQEARRIMEICNACRYCESLCPLFSEITRFRVFNERDLNYLANLCHNCKGCYYACQYATPHEFAINVPKTMSEVRVDSYIKYAYSKALGKFFVKNGVFATLIIAFSISLLFIIGIMLSKASIFTTYSGNGAFYKVIPSYFMVTIPTIITIYTLVSFYFGFKNFWHESDDSISDLKNIKLWKSAFNDIISLRHLDGGELGHGCTHTNDYFTHSRKWFHQATMFGFLFTIISTSTAAIYEHIFNLRAPYEYTSLPVIFGILGGVLIVIGVIGLVIIKIKADTAPNSKELLGMEYSFIISLFFVSITGLILLVTRESSVMPLFLSLHLGFVLGFFISMPYGKFVHSLYRLGALLRYARNRYV